MYLGLDWTEQHRIEGRLVKGQWVPGTRDRWLPWRTEYPLLDPPLRTKEQLLAHLREVRGVEPPRLYSQGFAHANCGGFCVRGGQAQWALALRMNRPGYLEWEAEEEQTRKSLTKNVSILRDRRGKQSRPLSLRQFREQIDKQPELFDHDDWGACGCTIDGPAA